MLFASFFVSLFVALLLIYISLPSLRAIQNGGQPLRAIGPTWHVEKKSGTPTMGGLFIIIATFTPILAFYYDKMTFESWIIIVVMASYGCIGFIDDYKKVKKRDSGGLSGKIRFTLELCIALAASYALYIHRDSAGIVWFGNYRWIDIGIFYVLFSALTITSSANAVNLTDGLDGLAIVPAICIAFTYIFIINYTGIDSLTDNSMICILIAFIGASLGYLWFNSQPASIMMGDVGSLSIGGMLGTVAVCAHQELALIISGIIFVIETLSVIIQVISFRFRGKRLFLMSPIHHHFEKIGMQESKIVIRFWIISIVASTLSYFCIQLS